MLLNPSHNVTFSGLPPDLLDTYVRYKKGTRALVAWFLQHSSSCHPRTKALSIREFEALAETVSRTIKTVPDVVHFYFRETIAARKRLSKHFRTAVDESYEDVGTVNHEHFTASLSKIYEDLCAYCGNPVARGPQQQKSLRLASLTEPPANTYDSLTVEEGHHYECEECTPRVSHPCPESSAAASSPCEAQGIEAQFAEDRLDTIIQVMAAVQRIHGIFHAVDDCWHLAGSGNISFIVASYVTNVAFALLRQVGVELLEYDANFSLSELNEIATSFHRSSEMKAPSGRDREGAEYLWLDQLRLTEQTLLRRSYCDGPLVLKSCTSRIQKPADYTKCQGVGHGGIDNPFLMAIVDNIAHLVRNKEIPPGIVRHGTPVYADVGYLITHADEKTQSWSPVLGLHLLTGGYETYLRSIGSSNMVSQCRITALRLATQASSQVAAILNDKTCFPCRCTQTLAFHLQTLETDLRSYQSFKCWDLYFQAPWVCGNHVLEILDLCHYYGTRLLNYRHYVGSVLHSYNVLKQLGGLEEIRVLENLCVQFASIFFPSGSVPKSNFLPSWNRYVGARLRFNKGHRSRNSRDSWCISVPTYAQRRAAGLGPLGDRPQTKVGCLPFVIKQQDYHLSDDQWDSLGQNSSTPADVRKNDKGSRDAMTIAHAPCSFISERKLLALSQAIRKTFENTDTLPLARINLFKIFEKCVCVVSRLSDETHTGVNDRGLNCICFASTIITAGDRIIDGRRLSKAETWKKHELECVTQAKIAIRETFCSLDEEEWLWQV